jgi:hypothetical protein
MAERGLFLPKNSTSSATPSGNGHGHVTLRTFDGRGTSKHVTSSWRFHIKTKCRKVYVMFGSCSSGESEAEAEDRTQQTNSDCGMPSASVANANADSEVKVIETASRLGDTSGIAHSIQDRKSQAVGSRLVHAPFQKVAPATALDAHATKSVTASKEISTCNAGRQHNGSSNIEQKPGNISKSIFPQWHMSAIAVIRGFCNVLSALLCLLIQEVSNGGKQVANAGTKFPSDKDFEILHALITVHGIVLAPVFALQHMGFVRGILRSFERKSESHFRVTSAPRRSGGVNPNTGSDILDYEKLHALIAFHFIVLAPVLALQQMWIYFRNGSSKFFREK